MEKYEYFAVSFFPSCEHCFYKHIGYFPQKEFVLNIILDFNYFFQKYQTNKK